MHIPLMYFLHALVAVSVGIQIAGCIKTHEETVNRTDATAVVYCVLAVEVTFVKKTR
jgi:hypothetical protein